MGLRLPPLLGCVPCNLGPSTRGQLLGAGLPALLSAEPSQRNRMGVFLWFLVKRFPGQLLPDGLLDYRACNRYEVVILWLA